MKNIGKISVVVVFAMVVVAIVVFTRHLAKPAYEVGVVKQTYPTSVAKNREWVTIINKDGVRNSNYSFANGDICMLNYDGVFSKVDSRGGLAIVRYNAPTTKLGPGGTECGNGTLFAVADEDLAFMHTNQQASQKDEAQARALVAQFKDASGQRLNWRQWSRENWVWVQVVNPDGVDNANGHFDAGDHCGIGEKPDLRILGIRASDQARLVRYDDPSGLGTACGTGTLFIAHLALDQYVPVDIL